MRKIRLLLCISFIVFAGPAGAHVTAGGYEKDSCNPHGLLLDANCGGAFSQCECTYIPDGSSKMRRCPGAKRYPDGPPPGTYFYHRVTKCPAGSGPTFPDPPFKP